MPQAGFVEMGRACRAACTRNHKTAKAARMTAQRYRTHYDTMREDPAGKYVEYADYAAVVGALEESEMGRDALLALFVELERAHNGLAVGIARIRGIVMANINNRSTHAQPAHCPTSEQCTAGSGGVEAETRQASGPCAQAVPAAEVRGTHGQAPRGD